MPWNNLDDRNLQRNTVTATFLTSYLDSGHVNILQEIRAIWILAEVVEKFDPEAASKSFLNHYQSSSNVAVGRR